MLDKGKDLDWFNSPVIVALGVFAAISFAFFVIWELTEKNPIVDLRLFGGRNFLGGTVAISVAYAVFFANLVLLPQWMQGYLNYRSVDAGLATAPLGIFAVILAPVMGEDHAEARTRACSRRWRSSASRACSSCARTTRPASIRGRSCCRRCCRAFRPRCSSCR